MTMKFNNALSFLNLSSGYFLNLMTFQQIT
jgi:hypothetical protein